MKFKCEKRDLVDVISIVQKSVPNKSTLPILEGIYIEARGNVITFRGTDVDVSTESIFLAEIEEEGRVVVDSKMFGDIIRKLPNTIITIETIDNNQVKISAERSVLNLLYLDANEFPTFPVMEESTGFSIAQNELKGMLKRILFSVAQDDSRPILMGALFEVLDGTLNIVALDSFRMAVVNTKIESDISLKKVVSGKLLKDITGILSDSDEFIDVAFNDNHVLFTIGNTKIMARLLQGEYIKYNNMIPDYSKLTVEVNRLSFLEACERASVMANEGATNLIKLNYSNNNIVITSNSKLGKIREEIECTMDGEDLEIAFNARYILDILKTLDDEMIKMEMTSGISPCILKPIENENSLYLVLPVRIAK